MKTVNAKLFAIIYTLIKVLTKKLDSMKQSIVEGANITFKDFADIKIVECTKKSYTKEAQAMLDKYAKENGLEKVETKYLRVEIDHIDPMAEETANKVIAQLEDSDDKLIKRVASKVASRK